MLVGGSLYTRAASFFILLASGIALVIAYAASILALKAIKEDEVRLLPCGNRIADLLIKHKLLKASQKSDEE